jgi:hypothetical protein
MDAWISSVCAGGYRKATCKSILIAWVSIIALLRNHVEIDMTAKISFLFEDIMFIP